MTSRNRLVIGVGALLAVAIIGVITLRMFEQKPVGVIDPSDVRAFNEEGVDFVVPKEWTVATVGDHQFEIRHSGKKNNGVLVFIDASEEREYASVLAQQRSRFIDVAVESVFSAQLEGQQLAGQVSRDGESSYVISSVLDKSGRAILIELTVPESNENREAFILDYKLIRSSLDLGIEPQPDPVLKDENGNEVVPVFVRDGVNSRQSFTDGVHTVSGYIEFPNPCYDFSVTTDVITRESSDFVLIRFSASQPLGQLCAQVITKKEFNVTFTASENATIQGQYNSLPVQLLNNL